MHDLFCIFFFIKGRNLLHIFSGLMPADMEKLHPNFWKNDTDEGGKNMHENDFLKAQLKRLGLNIKHEYLSFNA